MWKKLYTERFTEEEEKKKTPASSSTSSGDEDNKLEKKRRKVIPEISLSATSDWKNAFVFAASMYSLIDISFSQ